jgi:hypothetical protein
VDDIIAGTREDVYLRSGDIVFVPSTLIGQWNDLLKALLPTLNAFWQGSTIHHRLFVE